MKDVAQKDPNQPALVIHAAAVMTYFDGKYSVSLGMGSSENEALGVAMQPIAQDHCFLGKVFSQICVERSKP